jgi:probable F420-dependent oxidoreductase
MLSPMRIDCFLNGGDTTAGAPDAARAAEAAGVDAAWVGEVNNDPFLAIALAASATERVTLGTGVLACFSRSPMSVAHTAHDLQRLSGGRFVLGLGSQVKAHVTRRYGMQWGKPVARMREYVHAVRSVWRAWDEGEPLDVRGDFYELTLMTPMFHPAPNPHGPPRIFLSAVGPKMTALAGEVADGLFVHGFTTPSYVRDVTIPALGEKRPGFELVAPVFTATGRDEAELERAVATSRSTVAFYASTPAYRGVLEHHGWGDLQGELNGLIREGRWGDLAAAVPQEVLEELVTVAPLDELPAALERRWGGLLDRMSVPLPAVEAIRRS